jgi:hypothetical protein
MGLSLSAGRIIGERRRHVNLGGSLIARWPQTPDSTNLIASSSAATLDLVNLKLYKFPCDSRYFSLGAPWMHPLSLLTRGLVRGIGRFLNLMIEVTWIYNANSRCSDDSTIGRR